MRCAILLCAVATLAGAAPLWTAPLDGPVRELSVVDGVLRAELDDGRVFEVSAAGAKQLKVEAVERLVGEVDRVAGYGGTAFVAAGAVFRVDSKGTFALGKVSRATAVETYGGQVMVGNESGVWKVSMKDEATAQVAKLPAVEGLATDHVGYLVVTTAKGVKRVTLDGKVSDLAIDARGKVAFDGRSLFALTPDRKTVAAYDYVVLVGDDPAVWAKRDARPMKPFTLEGLTLTGGEYWPNRGPNKTKYPDDVLWGFYPERGVVFEGAAATASATPAAVACAETAYAALRAFVATRPAKLHALAKRPEISARFYLWVNDYSEAAADFAHPVRPARLWYWQRTPAVPGRIPGYWKWETTLTRDGTCHFPTEPQAGAYLDEKTAAVAK